MKLVLENKIKKIAIYICQSVITFLIFTSIYYYQIDIYAYCIFNIILLVINIFLLYFVIKVKTQNSIVLFITSYSLFAYLNVIYFEKVFTSYLYFIPLIISVRIIYSKRKFYQYVFILICLFLFIPIIRNWIKEQLNIDWHYLYSKNEIITNSIIDIVSATLLSIAPYLFLKELKNEGLLNKHLANANQNRDDIIDKLIFINKVNENPEYENKIEKLFFDIKRIIEKEMIYKDYKYDIAMLSKKLQVQKKDITAAINYHETGLDFDEILDFYRYKTVKKAFDEGLHTKTSIKEIYKAAGFKYESKFIAVFNYFEGTKPDAYIQSKEK